MQTKTLIRHYSSECQYMRVSIREEFGRACVDYDLGEQLYAMIHPVLSKGEEVELDFIGVEVFASPFFNASLARLVMDIPTDQLNERLHLPNLNPVGRLTARKSIDNAKEFYTDPDKRKMLDDVLRAEIEREKE
jgi:hypothetical protein